MENIHKHKYYELMERGYDGEDLEYEFNKYLNKINKKSITETFFGFMAQTKVYFNNSTFYLSVTNFILILATFKANYNIPISIYILAPLGLICFLIVGYIDYKMVYLKQATYLNKKNDIKIQLDRIENLMEAKK